MSSYGTAATPWSALDPALADRLRPVLPQAVDAIVAAIGAAVPEYRPLLDGPFGTALRRGVEIALMRHLDLLGTDEPALDSRARDVYVRVGAGEGAAGRSLEALLAAYRVGARAAWERLAGAATAGGVEPEQLAALAESVFVYIDELSSASVEGYASEQAARAGHRDVLRSRLAEALVEGGAATDPDAVQRLADAAGWNVPQRMAVAVIPRPAEGAVTRLPLAPPDALVLEQGPDVLAVIPDPSGPGRRERLSAPLVDSDEYAEVYVGTVRPPEEAPVSLAHARRVRRLVALGLVPPAPVVAAADHLPLLVVAADEPLLAELRRRTLAPLDGIPSGRRRALEETLAAWLLHRGDRQAMARELIVHPQTVSYRMRRLHGLFGVALDDPEGRLALQLAMVAPRPSG
ncbi:MAG: helix-turn-helix domain-containing protein [Candidatus Nanopelagicales bacterium]